MRHLIKNCKIIQKGNPFNGKKVDILIDKGIIKDIGKNLSDEKAKVISGKRLHASSGWVDIGTHLGEPGYEHRETFETLAKAALSGGYTDLVTMPKSVPAIQSKAQIKNIIDQGSFHGIDIHPLGALSNDLKGENITEFVDMHHGGAVGFSDGLNSISKSGLLMRALQYAKRFDGVILHHPNDASLANQDLIHEGAVSTQIGMKGSPSLAEELVTYRDVQLNKYAESRLNIHLISTKEATIIIKNAKKKDAHLTAGVSYLNLIKTDVDILGFDSNLKVRPILRDKKDLKSLRKGIGDDTFDYISSNHTPLETERKHLEYPYASHGAIGLETCFAALHSSLNADFDLKTLIYKLTSGPRSIFKIEEPQLEVGKVAKITLFDPSVQWTYSQSDVQSLSKNSPFVNSSFTGKVIGTFSGEKTNVNS